MNEFVKCGRCGAWLDADCEVRYDGIEMTVRVTVTPCPDCIADARSIGQEEAREEANRDA